MGKTRDSRGFTVIELLIVVVMIGLLAAMTLIAFNFMQQRAKNAVIKQSVAEWAKILKYYKANDKDEKYPMFGSSCLGKASDYPADAVFPAGASQLYPGYGDNYVFYYRQATLDQIHSTLKDVVTRYPEAPNMRIVNGRMSAYVFSTRGILHEIWDVNRNIIWIRYQLYGKNQNCSPGEPHMHSYGKDTLTFCRLELR